MWPIFDMRRGTCPDYIVFQFHRRPQKVVKVNFRDVVHIKQKSKSTKIFFNFIRCGGTYKYRPGEDRGPPIENL